MPSAADRCLHFSHVHTCSAKRRPSHFFVDGNQMGQGVLKIPPDVSPGALFGDISTSGGNVTADFEFIRIASLFTFSGFFPPISNPPVLNVVKAGQAIPAKFSLNGNQGLNIFATGYPISQQVNCATDAPVNDVQQTVTAGGSSLTYDSSTDQYTYVWKTDKSWGGTCRQLTVQLTDGTNHVAIFQFK